MERIVIVGGGIVGSCVAYHLALAGAAAVVTVVEPDPTYAFAGFSGHGLMHAPAVGRAVKEMILDSGFRSIDLARLSWRRVLDGRPLTAKA